MSEAKMLFRGPVGIPVLKRFGLNPGFCWHSRCLHRHLGYLPPVWQGNFQYVVKGLFPSAGLRFLPSVLVLVVVCVRKMVLKVLVLVVVLLVVELAFGLKTLG